MKKSIKKLYKYIRTNFFSILISILNIGVFIGLIELLKHFKIPIVIIYPAAGFILIITNFIILHYSQKDLYKVSNTIEKIVDGSLSLKKQIKVTSPGVVGEVVRMLNNLIQKIHDIIVSIIENTNQVSSSGDLLAESVANATDKIANTIKSIKKVEDKIKGQSEIVFDTEETMKELLQKLDEIHGSIETQSSSIFESSESIKGLVSSINDISEASKRAENSANNLKDVASEGSNSVDNAIIAIEEIEEASRQITEVIKIIRGISEQTNLLAMNAAIEAAHAGSHGMGFAVVAEEVRKLAENSKNRTREINDAIKSIMDKIKNGVVLSKQAGQSLLRITNDVANTVHMIDKITTETNEQKERAQKVLQALSSIEQITTDIRSFMEEQKNTAHKVSNVMHDLNDATETIKIDITEQGQNSESVVQSVLAINDIANENTITVIGLENTAREFNID